MTRHDKISDGGTSKSKLLGEGRFALGIFTGITVLLIFYLASAALDTDLNRREVIELVPAIVALMVASISLLISFQALTEQRKMRQAGTDPVLIAHLGGRKDSPILIMLKISNVGAGAATNVRVLIEEQHWPELLDRTHLTRECFEKPFMAVLQGKSVEYSLHVAHKLLGKNPVSPFEITLEYEDIDGGHYKSSHLIDPKELMGQSVTSPAETKIADSLDKIQKEIGKLTSGAKQLEVITETRQQRLERL